MSSPTYACSSACPSPRVDAPCLGIHCHCSSKSRSQATLSPGNTSLVHQGEDFSQAQREKKAERKKKKKRQNIKLAALFIMRFNIFLFSTILKKNKTKKKTHAVKLTRSYTAWLLNIPVWLNLAKASTCMAAHNRRLHDWMWNASPFFEPPHRRAAITIWCLLTARQSALH